jgi:hypothetical protein
VKKPIDALKDADFAALSGSAAATESNVLIPPGNRRAVKRHMVWC